MPHIHRPTHAIDPRLHRVFASQTKHRLGQMSQAIQQAVAAQARRPNLLAADLYPAMRYCAAAARAAHSEARAAAVAPSTARGMLGAVGRRSLLAGRALGRMGLAALVGVAAGVVYDVGLDALSAKLARQGQDIRISAGVDARRVVANAHDFILLKRQHQHSVALMRGFATAPHLVGVCTGLVAADLQRQAKHSLKSVAAPRVSVDTWAAQLTDSERVAFAQSLPAARPGAAPQGPVSPIASDAGSALGRMSPVSALDAQVG